MSMKPNINEEQVKKKIEDFRQRFLKKSKTIIQEHSYLLIGHLRSKHMTGGTTTDTRIRRRTGQLSDSMRPISPVKVTEKGVEGGVTFGKVYARVHIGPRGQVTTIKPKERKYLTVPFPKSPIMTDAGVVKATARELMEGKGGLPFGNTFIAKSKAGNLIIFGTKRITKGARIGEYRGEVIPLFILKKQVKVKARIHPEDFLKWSKKELKRDFLEKGIEASIKHG